MLTGLLKDFNKFTKPLFKLDKTWYKIVVQVDNLTREKSSFKFSCMCVAVDESH